MRKLCLVLLLSTAASAWAGALQTPTLLQIDKSARTQTGQTNAVPQTGQKSTTQIELFAQEMPLTMERPAPNEITRGHIDVDGSLVELARMDNPLQLINPAAPERYGSAEDNLMRDPASGKASGLKFLELRF
jgi:hypothetical protein